MTIEAYYNSFMPIIGSEIARFRGLKTEREDLLQEAALCICENYDKLEATDTPAPLFRVMFRRHLNHLLKIEHSQLLWIGIPFTTLTADGPAEDAYGPTVSCLYDEYIEERRRRDREKYTRNREEINRKAKARAAAKRAAMTPEEKKERAERRRIWYDAHRDEQREKGRAYRAENRERIRERAREYYRKNREKLNARQRELRAKKKEEEKKAT